MSRPKLDMAAESLVRVLPLMKAKMMRPLEHSNLTGLSPMQFWILTMVADMEAISVGEVAKQMMISKSNITAVMDKLVDAGLVERAPAAEDRRVVNVRATESGHCLLKAHMELVKESIRERMSGLSDDRLEVLISALNSMHEVISQME